MMSNPGLIASLRSNLRRLERDTGWQESRVVPTGLPEVDAALPDSGLACGRLHQMLGGKDGVNGPTLAFAAALAGRAAQAGVGPEAGGTVLWVVVRGSPDDGLYAPGVAAFGLTPERLLMVRAGDAVEVLWCMEEALRCPAVAAVVGQAARVEPTAGRRLQLAAEQGGGLGLLLPSAKASGSRVPQPVPASTRWRIDPAPAAAVPWDPSGETPGKARWTLTLQHCLGGVPKTWLVEADDATGDLAVVTISGDGSA